MLVLTGELDSYRGSNLTEQARSLFGDAPENGTPQPQITQRYSADSSSSLSGTTAWRDGFLKRPVERSFDSQTKLIDG